MKKSVKFMSMFLSLVLLISTVSIFTSCSNSKSSKYEETTTKKTSSTYSGSYSASSGSSSSTNSSSSSSSKSQSSFTNKFGTRTTKCAISGCTNYIASSGDTNCCTKHSRKCMECYCYIDSDAMYCMSCLEKALK